MRTPGECEDALNVEVYLELEARGEVLRPERAACRNRAWRASQDVLQSWKVPSGNRWEGDLEKRKVPRGKALLQGFEQWKTIIELRLIGP